MSSQRSQTHNRTIRRGQYDTHRHSQNSARLQPSDKSKTVTGKSEKNDQKPKSKNTTTAPKTKSKPALPRQSRSMVLARPSLKPKKKKIRKKSLRRPKVGLKHAVLLFMVIVNAVLSAVYVVPHLRGEHSEDPMDVVAVNTITTDSADIQNSGHADETEVLGEVISNYEVAHDLPRLLIIDKIGVKARVKRVGVGPAGAMLTPSNINDVGWYDGSVKPGEKGAVVLNGHITGASRPGVFDRLGSLKENDVLKIERGDGKIVNYKVVGFDSVERGKLKLDTLVESKDPSKPGLNIVTASVRFDVRTNKFEPHLILYTVQQ